MIRTMQALNHFFQRHNLPMPEGIEFRFKDQLAAHRFEAALKMDFERDGSYVLDTKLQRVTEVCGFKIQPTFQEYGPPYSVDMLPAYHPAVKPKPARD